MTAAEKFGLYFFNTRDPSSGKTIPGGCLSRQINEFSVFQFIGRLNSGECQFLIEEIEKAENGFQYDDLPTSDSYEDIRVNYVFPNVIIDDILTVSMSDFKELLQEWLAFINLTFNLNNNE